MTNSIDGEAIPEKIVTERDPVWKRLSPDEGYLLGFVDGNTSLNDLADITGWETQILNRAMARLMKVQVYSFEVGRIVSRSTIASQVASSSAYSSNDGQRI